MLKKVMRGIKATIHGGTKYERSVKKTLNNDDDMPKEKHLLRIVNGITDQDIETGVVKSEQIFESKLEEARQEQDQREIFKGEGQGISSQSLKVLLVIDMVADQKIFWTTQEERKISAWIMNYFIDRHGSIEYANNVDFSIMNPSLIDPATQQPQQQSLLYNQQNILVSTKSISPQQEKQADQSEFSSSGLEIDSAENMNKNSTTDNRQSDENKSIKKMYSHDSNIMQNYSTYLLEKVKVLNDLRSYVSGQLSAGGTPLEEFFACFSRLESFEELAASFLQSIPGIEEKQKVGAVKAIQIIVFGSECCLFGLMLVLIALFAERCCLNAGRLSLARLIDAVGGLLQRARRFIAVLKQSSDTLSQFQLLIYKLQISLLSSEFTQMFSNLAAEPTGDAKVLTTRLKAASLDFATIALNLENKSAFANLLKIHFQDLLSEYDTNRTFAKLEGSKPGAADPFEAYQNVYSVGITI